MTRPSVHLRPNAELAERVLLPGDPGRALAVAQELIDGPKMFNHNRGLWGYTGPAGDGELLTVQATGMGGPSAAIVCEELIALGARRLVRIGTCGALLPDGPALGELLAAERVLAEDGTSRALGADEELAADPELTAGLAGARPATIATTDLFFDPRADAMAEWAERGAEAVEMEAAAVLAVGAAHGVPAACVLAVSDVPADGASGIWEGARRIGPEALEQASLELGRSGYAALRAG